MKRLARLATLRAARRRPRRKSSKLTPAGTVAFARGTRTGSGGLTGLGLFLLAVGAARRRSKRGQLIYRRRVRPGHALRIAVTTRAGRVTELD